MTVTKQEKKYIYSTEIKSLLIIITVIYNTKMIAIC